ncbi:MAG: response regulator [Bacteroidota bacterium]
METENSAETNKAGVLLVEDDPVTSFFMKKILSRHYDVQHASNSTEALSLVEEKTPHVILMDINLGEESLDGVGILKEIRKEKKYDPVKILAVTSYALDEDRERFLKEGFDAYIPKPVKQEPLLKEIECVLNTERS